MAERKKAPAAVRVERTRSSFKSLVAGNPNYFGNLPTSGFKAIKKMASNTNYEALSSVGYNPRQRRLYATFDLKKSGGYSGDLCDDGSTEYVRFYVDFGAGWQDAGLAATDVHDIPVETDCANVTSHPLAYSVEVPYAPRRRWCVAPQLPKVRAILSWNAEPPAGDPDFKPAYGDVRDCAIQIDKSRLFIDWLDELVTKVDVPLDLLETIKPVLPPDPPFPDIPDLPEPPYPGPDPGPLAAKTLTIDERIELYAQPTRTKRVKLAVEPHRIAFSEVQAIMAQPDLMAGASLSAKLGKYGIDLAELVAAAEDTTGNISYEELVDLGLEGNREKLVATYRVKKQTGFSGPFCTAGSTEYVAFWADWNDTCEWEYLDTVAVNAYDFAVLPDGGLCYTAALPVDLEEIKRACTDPKIARVRAVLSWNAPPSTTDPDAVPTWGNRLDAHVLVPRREGSPGTLKLIGGISTEFISDVTGMVSAAAKFADTGVPVYSPLGLDCPFGGLITVRGPAVTGKRYRIQVIDSGGASQTLTEKIWVTPRLAPSHYHTSTPDGWFDYLDYDDNFTQELGYYRSSGDDKVTIQLEIEGEGIVDSQVVQLDNTWPEMAISITEPGTDCGLFGAGVLLKGSVIATDTHMGGWSVAIDGGPAGFGPVAATTGAAGNTNTPLAGSEWTFDTTGLEQCGYVARVHVRDRAIVNSGNHQHARSVDVGFCILE